jgi:hypothetical protein
MKEVKEHLKLTGKEIRQNKNKRPFENRGNTPLWEIENKIEELKYNYRHHHIAYCELRGRTREQIERPSSDNTPNENYITNIKKEILDRYAARQEVIRNCA